MRIETEHFAVLTNNAGEHEAWAYEGPWTLKSPRQIRFGLGNTPIDAMKALDWQLEVDGQGDTRTHGGTPASHVPCIIPKAHRPDHLDVDARELATILAALRFHQDENLQGRSEIADLTIKDIATDGETLQALSFQEIDALCQRLNAGTKVRKEHFHPAATGRKGRPDRCTALFSSSICRQQVRTAPPNRPRT